MRFCSAIILSFLIHSLFAQNAQDYKDLENAKVLFLNGQFQDVIVLLERIKNIEDFIWETTELRSKSYTAIGEYNKALLSTQHVFSQNAPVSIKKMHVENLMHCDLIIEAVKVFRANDELKSDKNLQIQLDSTLRWKSRANCKIKNHNCNTEFAETSPLMLNEKLLFSSNRESILIKAKNTSDRNPFLNFYSFSNNTTSIFSSEINGSEHDFAPAINSNYDTLFFTRRIKKNVNGKWYYFFKLYCSEKTKDKWTKPNEFILNDSSSNYAYPFFDQENQLFYFASDMAGGFGGWDLYICIKTDSLWSEPINLGPKINSNGNEIYPFAKSGKLFFSSDGHLGMGGYDLYSTMFKRGTWTVPRNLGYPVNSGADDTALTFSKSSKSAWFVSNRIIGMGQEDIYEILDTEFLFK